MFVAHSFTIKLNFWQWYSIVHAKTNQCLKSKKKLISNKHQLEFYHLEFGIVLIYLVKASTNILHSLIHQYFQVIGSRRRFLFFTFCTLFTTSTFLLFIMHVLLNDKCICSRYCRHKPTVQELEQIPKYVMIFMNGIQFKFKTTQQIHDHHAQCMIQNPRSKTRQMRPWSVTLEGQCVHETIDSFSL